MNAEGEGRSLTLLVGVGGPQNMTLLVGISLCLQCMLDRDRQERQQNCLLPDTVCSSFLVKSIPPRLEMEFTDHSWEP